MQLDPDEVDDLASWHGRISKWDLYLSFSHQSSQVRDVEPENCINSPRLATMVLEIHSTRHRASVGNVTILLVSQNVSMESTVYQN